MTKSKIISPNPFNIIFGIDDHYILHTLACINSLLINNPLQKFHIYILTLNVLATNKEILQNWIVGKKQDITFIDIDSNIIKDFPIQQHDYISLASYLRLFIPQLLPKNISKALYIDGDIIFNGPISELYNIDISNYASAAVEDAPNDNPSRLGYDSKYSYFNAGFQLLNVEYLRQINFTDKALDYIRKNFDKIVLHDQDVMNALLYGRVLFLPIKWNMLDCYYTKPLRIAEIYQKDIKKYRDNAITIHFSGPLKPWHYGCRHPLKKLYKRNVKNLHLKMPIDRWDGLRKFPKEIRWMVLLKFPWIFIDYANVIIQRIKERFHIL